MIELPIPGAATEIVISLYPGQISAQRNHDIIGYGAAFRTIKADFNAVGYSEKTIVVPDSMSRGCLDKWEQSELFSCFSLCGSKDCRDAIFPRPPILGKGFPTVPCPEGDEFSDSIVCRRGYGGKVGYCLPSPDGVGEADRGQRCPWG